MMAGRERLDRYWAEELGCTPDALTAGGVTVCAPPHRERPRWMGWLVPLECIVAAHAASGTGVISIAPSLAAALRGYLKSVAACDCLPPAGRGLDRFVQLNMPSTAPKVHVILSCEPQTFTPAQAVYPVSQLDEDDVHASWYRSHFDGPVFVARNERGAICSWAAIKCKSDDIWEMAVATEPPYRNRGLARSVVTRATEAAFRAGKQPLYLHEISNFASAGVSRALGYTFYGYELTCEQGRIAPARSRRAS